MKKILIALLLLSSQYFLYAQSTNLGGTYPDSGYLFHPTSAHQFNNNQNHTKLLTEVSPNVYEMTLADFGDAGGFKFQFEVDANNNLVNFVLSGTSSGTYAQADFMTSDNSVGVTYYPGTTTGYVHSSYPNIYDPATNTFYLHYGYSLDAATPFTRQCYEKMGTGASIMPLKMLSFTAVRQDNNAMLKWETANEYNTAYTNVQRSMNGIEFSTVGKVNSNGFGNGSYNYSDDVSSSKAVVAYYRLQSMDKDGAFKYSEIRSVRLQATSAYTFSPNPAKGFINITGDKVKTTTISDLNGKKVLSSATNRINVSNLVKGIYILSITGADGYVHSEKLLID